MTGRTPQYLTCDCGYPLSERVVPNESHLYVCLRCGLTREKTDGR